MNCIYCFAVVITVTARTRTNIKKTNERKKNKEDSWRGWPGRRAFSFFLLCLPPISSIPLVVLLARTRHICCAAVVSQPACVRCCFSLPLCASPLQRGGVFFSQAYINGHLYVCLSSHAVPPVLAVFVVVPIDVVDYPVPRARLLPLLSPFCTDLRSSPCLCLPQAPTHSVFFFFFLFL
jgi:hypothetical protein